MTVETLLLKSTNLSDSPVHIALSFVQTLLELDSRKRLHINKVFLQPWLQVVKKMHLVDFLFFRS